MNDSLTPTLLVRTQEAARLLGVCERTIANIVKRGDLAPVRLGGAVRFDRADLVALIDRKKRSDTVSTLPEPTPN